MAAIAIPTVISLDFEKSPFILKIPLFKKGKGLRQDNPSPGFAHEVRREDLEKHCERSKGHKKCKNWLYIGRAK